MYSGVHSIIFFDNEEITKDTDIWSNGLTKKRHDTWEDFGLIPTSRPIVAPPPTKTNTVDIPGTNGKLDLSEATAGYPLYENRTGEWEFVCETTNDPNDKNYWRKRYSELTKYLHGKKLKMILRDEIEEKEKEALQVQENSGKEISELSLNDFYYYEGRFEVSDWKNGESWSTVTISYDLYPFRKSAELVIREAETNKGTAKECTDMGSYIKIPFPTSEIDLTDVSEQPVMPSFYAYMSDGTSGKGNYGDSMPDLYLVISEEIMNPDVPETFTSDIEVHTIGTVKLVKDENGNQCHGTGWAMKKMLKSDGTGIEDAWKDKRGLNKGRKYYCVSDFINVESGDILVVTGDVSKELFSRPYLVAYDNSEPPQVVECLYAYEGILEFIPYSTGTTEGMGKGEDLFYGRFMQGIPYTVPEGVCKIRLCLLDDDLFGSSEDQDHKQDNVSGLVARNVHFKGTNLHYLPLNKKTYFPDITLTKPKILSVVPGGIYVKGNYSVESMKPLKYVYENKNFIEPQELKSIKVIVEYRKEKW